MLSEAQIERYARHILLREVGGVGQKRLLGSEVRIEGLGQVGTWASIYLALAGVGSLELYDDRELPSGGLLPLLGPAPERKGRAVLLAEALSAHNPDVRFRVSGAGAPLGLADQSLFRPAEGEALLWARAVGTACYLGWVEALPCEECFPAGPPAAEVAALAGSLAASRILAYLLFGEVEPGILAVEAGREEVREGCPHR